MPKAPRISTAKSPRKGKDNDDRSGDANIVPERFRTLAAASSFSLTDAKAKTFTVRTGQYARFLGTPLMGLSRPIRPWEWWVGKILEIRKSDTDAGYWLCVQWLWSAEEIKSVGVKSGDVSCMGRWERSTCESVKSQDYVHSGTVDGPADVRQLNEHIQFLPDTDVFYIRSTFRFAQKILEFSDKELQCRCADCSITYNPDDAVDKPLRFCAHCKVWSHSNCLEDGRLAQSNHFSNVQHHAKGLLLSGLAEPAHLGPKSQKARIVARRALDLDLGTVSKSVPDEIASTLIAIAQTRIVRPLPGNIAGNIAYVLRAREWIREARTSGGLSHSRRGILKNWYKKLTETIDLDDALSPDTREEARLSELYVCTNCGYPV